MPVKTPSSITTSEDAILRISIADHIARVELNRPPVNALNREMVGLLTRAAGELAVRSDVWLVAVTSRTNVFCAGADLKERAGIPDSQVLEIVQGIQNVARAWSAIPQPVVMGIAGAALGGGLEFALSADILAASDEAILGLPEVSLGIIPAAGGTHRLIQRTSLGVARKWVLSAKPYNAEEALTDGVVDVLFPAATFAASFEELVHAFMANAPLAMRQAKHALTAASRDLMEKGFRTELVAYRPLIQTTDRKAALAAFAEKRRPTWRGE
jgi:methylglutaconyl-CoA hydratase